MKHLFLATEDNKMQLYHLLLNAINFKNKGHEVVVVLECASPNLLIGISDGSIKMPIFHEAMRLEIINHACKACTTVFSAVQAAKTLGVPLKGSLSGHTDLLPFAEEGYQIVTF